MGIGVSFSIGKAVRGVKLIIHVHLLPKLKTREEVPSLAHKSPSRGA
jgi:hypothetical protein